MDSDQFKREEDFYYTEMQLKEESALAVAAPPAPGTPSGGEPAPTSRVTSPSLAPLSLPPPKGQASGPEHAGLESPLPSVALSKSAPGSFWHIQADHAYQVCMEQACVWGLSQPGISVVTGCQSPGLWAPWWKTEPFG